MSGNYSYDKPTFPGDYWVKEGIYRDYVSVADKKGRLVVTTNPFKNICVDDITGDVQWCPAVIPLSVLDKEIKKLSALMDNPKGIENWMFHVQAQIRKLNSMAMIPINTDK